MPWGYAAAAIGTAAAGSMNADAVGDAADQQAGAAGQANALSRYQYDTNRADQAPFLEAGQAGVKQLAYLLGIGGNTIGTKTNSLANSPLVSGTGYNSQLYNNNEAYRKAWDEVAGIHQAAYGKGYNKDSDMNWVERQIRDRLGPAYEAEKLAQEQQSSQSINDPLYGSLLKKFDANDLANDVVYNSGLKFGLDQGTNAINQRALQSGGYDSGNVLKELSRYANDYGSTKANEAYNRYNADQTNVYNRLAGISGTGQTAANQVGSMGLASANQQGENLMNAANSRAAGIIGGANAWGDTMSGLSGIYNNYNQNQTLQSLLKRQNNQAYFGSGGMNGFGDSYGTSYGE